MISITFTMKIILLCLFSAKTSGRIFIKLSSKLRHHKNIIIKKYSDTKFVGSASYIENAKVCKDMLLLVESRKYDIEAESLKLYGEDLNSVLLRFRKSPEYLKILNDKVTEMKLRMNTFIQYLVIVYKIRLSDKINEKFPLKKDNRTKYLRNGGSFLNRDYNSKNDPYLRQDTNTSQEVAKRNELDDYVKLKQRTPAHVINSAKNLGFESFGNLVHNLIKLMGAEDTKEYSTKLPDGGDSNGAQTSSTKHQEHTVSPTEVVFFTTEAETVSVPNAKHYVRHTRKSI